MAERGQYAQQNEETFYLVMLFVIPVAFIGLWLVAGRYVYAWERTLLYGILSLWGLFPTDWWGLGWLTRKFLYFRYTHPSEIEFVQDVLPDALVVNGVLCVVLLVMVMRRVIYVGKEHPFVVHGRKLNVYDYMFQQMPLYPHLRIMWKLRLLARPLDDGLFRMADSAKTFAIRNRLVNLAAIDSEPVLDEDRAQRTFEAQLKRMLPMPTKDPVADAKACIARLTNDEKAILSAIACRLAVCDANVSDADFNAGLGRSDQLVKQFWEGFDNYHPALPTPEHHRANPNMPLVPPPPPVDTSGCDEVLLKYLVYPRVRESMVAHAYVRTFIYDALQACRKVGKFPPSRFGWLRMKDRGLWLMISSAGRATPFWEAAGLHAHYLWERKAKVPTERPQVGEAVGALETEFADLVAFTKVQREQIWAYQGGAGFELPRKKGGKAMKK